MEPGPLGDKQKMECRAKYDMKGEKTECQCRQLLFFQNGTLRWQLAMAWLCGRPLFGTHTGVLVSQKKECGAFRTVF